MKNATIEEDAKYNRYNLSLLMNKNELAWIKSNYYNYAFSVSEFFRFAVLNYALNPYQLNSTMLINSDMISLIMPISMVKYLDLTDQRSEFLRQIISGFIIKLKSLDFGKNEITITKNGSIQGYDPNNRFIGRSKLKIKSKENDLTIDRYSVSFGEPEEDFNWIRSNFREFTFSRSEFFRFAILNYALNPYHLELISKVKSETANMSLTRPMLHYISAFSNRSKFMQQIVRGLIFLLKGSPKKEESKPIIQECHSI